MNWHRFNAVNVIQQMNAGQFFVGVESGSFHVGIIKFVEDGFLTLQNGDHHEVLYFRQRTGMRFAMVNIPEGIRFGVADPKLTLE